jgi:NAD(P)H-hydrate epimerase
MNGEPKRRRLTRAQVREVDRLAIEEYHVPGIVLMENAARAVVDVARRMTESKPCEVAVVCGGGNNGGDGLAVARHLHNWGYQVLVIDGAAEFKGDALINSRIVDAMGIDRDDVYNAEDFLNPHAIDFVIDALFGTGLTRPPTGDVATLIELINGCELPVLSVDLPSGLDCDTGEALGPCVRATTTVTFVAEKAGFANAASREYTGEIIVGDIGCPRELINRVVADKGADIGLAP